MSKDASYSFIKGRVAESFCLIEKIRYDVVLYVVIEHHKMGLPDGDKFKVEKYRRMI